MTEKRLTSWEQFLESIGREYEPPVGAVKTTDRQEFEEKYRQTVLDWKKPKTDPLRDLPSDNS